MSRDQTSQSFVAFFKSNPLPLLPDRAEGGCVTKRNVMMNHTDRWMGEWTGGSMWFGGLLGVAIVILLVVLISKLSMK